MAEAALHTEKLTIDSIHVPIARDNASHFTRTRTERHLATVGTEVTRRDRLREFPRARLVAISRVEQRSGRTNLDAVAALRTIEPAHVSADDGVRAAAARFDRFF